MKKIIIVFGTRPEAIKMAPLVNKLKMHSEEFETIVCVTAQHREMLDQVLNLFDIKPDYDLNIMKIGQDLFDITSDVLLGLKKILEKENPDIILVHGDTTTSFSASLAAYYKQIPVGHIEAGLRTNDIYSPWPEEINRQLTARISAYHFSPTEQSKNNLIKENINEKKIYVTGNTVIDALHFVVNKFINEESLRLKIKKSLTTNGLNKEKLEHWVNGTRKFILITGHRRENFGTSFIEICQAIKELSLENKNIDFVYPMHLNPNVREPIKKVFGENLNTFSNIFFIEPLEYLQFVYLMYYSHLILTDSGGIQEEAPGLNKPVFVMRNKTERTEGVDSGTIKLVGTNKKTIIAEINSIINNNDNYLKMIKNDNPYGNGKACEKIIQILKNDII